MRRRLIEIGSALLALGGAMLAVYPLKDPIESRIVILPNGFYFVFLLLGLLLVAFGLTLFVLLLLPIKALEEKLDVILEGPDYDCRPAKTSELKSLRDYGKTFFGEDVCTLKKMKQWHSKNPNIYWLLVHNKSTQNKTISRMVGYYNLLPLTAEASDRVEREELNGTLFMPDHIVEDGQKPSSIYIGGIAANAFPFRARSVILTYLKEHLKRERERGVTKIYTRPVTRRGLQLVERNNFSPVNAEVDQELSRIYKSKGQDAPL